VRTGEAWQRFLREPGDVVVAATQGAGCFGAAYEFLFNTSYQLRKAGPVEERAFADIKAVCVMDAGNNGVIILADKMLPPRKHGVMIPGPQSHAMKLAFEKYFLWKSRNGYVNLP
jgi:hypothetical protein